MVDLPAIEVNPDGQLNTKNPPGAYDLPAIEVNPDGYLNTTNPPRTFNLPAIEVNPDGYLNVKGAPGVVASPVGSPAAEPVAQPGFDWGDAGIGIAIGIVASMALGAVLLIGHRRRALQSA